MLDHDDFYQEFLRMLNQHKVRYLIFGGFAVNFYGFTRVTEDLDIWIDPSPSNLDLFGKSVIDLGFPKEEQTLKNFLSGESIMLRLTDSGFRIDAITKLNIRKDFNNSFKSSTSLDMPYGKIHFLGYDDLIDEKIRAKRPKDIIDVDQLRTIRKEWGKK